METGPAESSQNLAEGVQVKEARFQIRLRIEELKRDERGVMINTRHIFGDPRYHGPRLP